MLPPPPDEMTSQLTPPPVIPPPPPALFGDGAGGSDSPNQVQADMEIGAQMEAIDALHAQGLLLLHYKLEFMQNAM